MEVLVSAARIEGESYVFNCRFEGENFRLVGNRQALDGYDERLDPKQPVSGRLARLAWQVAPHVLAALRNNRKPVSGLMLLSPEHLAPVHKH
jgi:hypothetical protein